MPVTALVVKKLAVTWRNFMKRFCTIFSYNGQVLWCNVEYKLIHTLI